MYTGNHCDWNIVDIFGVLLTLGVSKLNKSCEKGTNNFSIIWVTVIII